MKNHKNLIRLIIATAALVAVGVFAFKYLRTYNLSELYHHKQAQVEVIDQLQKNDVTIQSYGLDAQLRNAKNEYQKTNES